MNAPNVISVALEWIGALLLAGGGLGAISYGLFKAFGAKWLEARFAERLQNLKSEQDQTIRYVQSTIDREIHRAKKLYDNEFTSLSDAWRKLRAAYDLSASTIGSFIAGVKNLNEEELERHLVARGMEEWRRNDFKKLKGQPLEDEYYKWSEWQRAVECDKLWRDCRQQIDSTSIFFPSGFTEKFRAINDMICSSNVEYEDRIREYKVPQYGQGIDRFECTKKLRGDGKVKMDELETMVRDRLWSVAKEA